MPSDTAVASNADPYLALGVRPFINCCGVRTLHGGTLLSGQAKQAMAAAAQRFVDLDELMEGAGQRIAELTGAEWGLVTCGSAAALALGTAACVAGNDPVKMLRLPFTEGMANRVVMLRGQRFAYDTAIRMVGTHVIEVGDRAELAAAMDGRVAMVAVLGKDEEKGALRLEDFAAAAKPRGIPILVDAASEHLVRPNPWLSRGADLVVYSGGKFLRGPQTSGLLLGTKPLVQAAWRNASPHHGFGRPMKVSKEDVIGVVAALEHWFGERDATAEARRWRGDLDEIIRHVGRLPGVTWEFVEPAGTVLVPRLAVRWDADRYAIDGVGLRQLLLDGSPRVMLDDRWAFGHEVGIDPFNFQPGEAAVVGRALAGALAGVGRAPSVAAADPGVDVAGEWQIQIKFLHGVRSHRLRLQQRGGELAGDQQSDGFAGAVSGSVEADRVRLRFNTKIEGTTIVYLFEGQAQADGMAGTVQFGSANDSNVGVVNRRQYGGGRWEASRLA
jgi:D-glucosaminate-6-phosphate ammonia-lyase